MDNRLSEEIIEKFNDLEKRIIEIEKSLNNFRIENSTEHREIRMLIYKIDDTDSLNMYDNEFDSREHLRDMQLEG